MIIHSRYSKKPVFKSRPPGTSMTQQSLANESDINKIMAKARKTGQMPLTRTERVAQYGDFSNIDTYHNAQNKIAECNEQFMKLSATIRARFDNDPHELIKFLQDPENEAEAIKIGLVKAPPPVPEEIIEEPIEEPPLPAEPPVEEPTT